MGGQWTLVQPEGLAPAPRGAHACVAVGTRVLVFGGADRAPITFSDLWLLDTAGGKYTWTRVSPVLAPGCKLLPRSGATLTVVDDRVYLFGGTEPISGACYNDLKVLDVDTWTWSDVEAQGTLPPARHSHCAGCLAGTCLIIHGGAGYQGPMQDVWIFNTLQGGWSRAAVSGEQPAAREMHTGCMVGDTTLLVYGGRGAEFKVLCDAALFDAKAMRWTAVEPTPFSRCAHSCVVLPATAAAASGAAAVGHQERPGLAGGVGSNGQGGSAESEAQQQQEMEVDSGAGGISGAADNGCDPAGSVPTETASSSSAGAMGRVIIYGGFSGDAVEGDVLLIDGRTLEIELVRRGPRTSDKGGTVPPVRFAHSAAVVPAPDGSGGVAMVVFGGVNPKEDLNDVAVWVPDAVETGS